MEILIKIDMGDFCRSAHRQPIEVFYGTILAAIQYILDYLHETSHFKKYNRVAYAYRVEEVPIVFITEKKNTENQHY